MNGNFFSKGTSATYNYTNAEIFATPSQEVNNGSFRLEAAFYGSAGYRALQQMKQSGFSTTTIGERARVIWLGPFRRIWVADHQAGIPFHSSSTMLMASSEPSGYISRALTPKLHKLIVKEGTILISCSGTIGNTAICTSEMHGAALSQHAIRLIPENRVDRGWIFAFLECECGQFLVKRSRSGSVIESIYKSDIASLPIPLLPKALREELTRLVDEYCALQVKANRLLDETQREVQRSCYLPDLTTFVPKKLVESHGNETVFVSHRTERFASACQFGELRLDATYHDPIAVAFAKYILSSEGGCTLSTLVKEIRNSALRKRIYVDDPSLGIPLLGGKQMMQWRPKGVNYLSNAFTRNLQNETVQNGWTLISCGGTLGRTMYVHRNFEGWAASQDVMRIVPNSRRVFPGFLYAFLASKYGHIQLLQRGYGSVIPRLRDFQFLSIAVRLPSDRGESVHNKVIEVFDARAEARNCEDQAVTLFTTALERGREYVESEWGEEY